MGIWPILAIIINILSTSLCTYGVINKCCEKGFSLNGTDCVPTSHIWLYMNFTYGFPNCDYDVVLAEENDTVSCIDNKLMSDTVLGIKCIKDIDPFQFSVPPVNYLRKCCPINRGYDTSLQSCWSDRTEYHTGLPQDLVNILIPGYDGVVDIRTGSPICEPDEVLVDHLVPYSRVRREKSESIVIKLKEGLNETILNPDEACLDLTERHNILVLRVCQNEWTACRPRGRHTCIRKCCPDGESYVNHVCAPSTSVIKPLELYNFTADGSKIPFEHIRPALFYGDLCQDKYFLNPEEDPADEFSIGIDGLIHYAVGMLEYNYCIENTNSSEDGLQGDYVFVCFKDEEDPYSHKTFYSYIMIISCISLTITLVVYTCLPQLRNLHGKTLMCYVSCLLASYSCLVYVSLDELHSYVSCIVSAYVMQFFFLAAFSWLNVISFDIWWTFGSMKSAIGKKARDRRRFIIYSMYAWSFASIITSFTIVVDYTDILPEYLRASMGLNSCWFKRDKLAAIVVFFVGPSAVLFGMNFVFFTLTAIHCSKVKNELHKIAHSGLVEKRFRSDKRKLIMNCKLFIVMGVSWILEALSTCLPNAPEQIWVISDIANALQGFLIFAIFILKRRVLKAFKRRILQLVCRVKPKEHRPSCSTMYTVSQTESCKLSTTVSMIPHHHLLKKSTSDSRLAVPSPSPLRNQLHHRFLSSSVANRLNVNHH